MVARIEVEIYRGDHPIRLEASEDHSLVRVFSESDLVRTLRIPRNPVIQHAKLPNGTISLFQRPPVEVVGMIDERKNQLTDNRFLGMESRVDEKGNVQPPELIDVMRVAQGLGYDLDPSTKRIPLVVRLWVQASLGLAFATIEEEIEQQKE